MELYYYTSTDTMRYILEKGDIFATNIRYMNDSEEYTNGLEELFRLAGNEELVNKWLNERGRNDIGTEDIKQTFTEENLEKCRRNMDYYSISFCQKNDLLSQWAIYAKESGASIKMNFENDSYHFYTDSEEKGEKSQWELAPEKVLYFTRDSMEDEKDEYKRQAFLILDKLYARDFKDQTEGKDEVWRYVSTFVKRYDFYQEAESRLVFQPTQTAYYPRVQYRMDQKVLKPYLDMICKDGWPIWEIMIGPGFNQQVVYNSVEHFLNHVEIKVGIRDTEDYLKRIEEYWKPYADELKGIKIYDDLQRHIMDAKTANMRLEAAQIAFDELIQQVCNFIHEDDGCSEGLKKYIKRHRFMNKGIVLSSSSIPFIY
ncbi:MAG: hypothetical protein HFG81_01690 [Dorea sp.]|nr:hypothetical protein [Dorea sp.]